MTAYELMKALDELPSDAEVLAAIWSDHTVNGLSQLRFVAVLGVGKIDGNSPLSGKAVLRIASSL